MDKLDIRLTFTKTDRAKYISHLDLNRAMQRALKRAKIPVWYTQGFNPHAYIMFPLALSLGFDSKCELMDISLTTPMDYNEVKDKLNAVLPEGLKIVNVAPQIKKHTEIEKSEFRICITSENPVENISEKFKEFMNSEKIEVEKTSKKKGTTLIDIKPFVEIVNKSVEADNFIIVLRLPAGTQTNINPTLLIEAFQKTMNTNFNDLSVERTKILCADNEIFM